MKQLFINLVGHNASGKTTLAKQLATDFNYNRVSGDDFREFVQDTIPYFKETDMSYPNERYSLLNPLVIDYRQELSWILLRAGQSVLFDGGGSKKAYRKVYLDKIREELPTVVRVIILVDITEEELLRRLETRGGDWLRQYNELKKEGFEPPENTEADIVLRYTQDNYEEIKQALSGLAN